MSKLGDFLEVVCGRAEPFRTLSATIRHSRLDDIAEQASHNETPIGRRKAEAVESSKSETNLSVWMALPDCLRIESESNKRGKTRRELTVVNRQQSWTRDHEGHVETTPGRREPGRDASLIERHFDRARLREFLVGLTMESLGATSAAGQDCICVRATPRPEGNLWPHWIPPGADEYELNCDPRHGAILSIIARCHGTEFEMNEVTSVEFDQPIQDDLFTYDPRGGEQVVAPVPIAERLSLAAAVKRMPFTVLVPSRLPDADHAHLEVMYHPPRIHAARAYLMLMYRLGAGSSRSDPWQSLWISQSAVADPHDGEFEWEPVERDGKQLRLSDPGPAGMRLVALEQAGTHATITSDLDRTHLLDLATSLVPA